MNHARLRPRPRPRRSTIASITMASIMQQGSSANSSCRRCRRTPRVSERPFSTSRDPKAGAQETKAPKLKPHRPAPTPVATSDKASGPHQLAVHLRPGLVLIDLALLSQLILSRTPPFCSILQSGRWVVSLPAQNFKNPLKADPCAL
jgi:hypothetical protein